MYKNNKNSTIISNNKTNSKGVNNKNWFFFRQILCYTLLHRKLSHFINNINGKEFSPLKIYNLWISSQIFR